MGLGQVFPVGAVPLEEVRHGVEPEAVEADVEPVADDVEHGVGHLGVVVVEVRLVGEEAVPVVLAPLGVPCPVGLLRVDENDAGFGVTLVVVAPHVPVGLRVGAVLAGLAEPRVLVAGVVHDQVGDDPDAPPVGLLDQLGDVGQLAVLGQDRPEVADVVTAVAQRRLVERQQPEAVDPQPLEVVQLADDAGEVARCRRCWSRRSPAPGSRRTRLAGTSGRPCWRYPKPALSSPWCTPSRHFRDGCAPREPYVGHPPPRVQPDVGVRAPRVRLARQLVVDLQPGSPGARARARHVQVERRFLASRTGPGSPPPGRRRCRRRTSSNRPGRSGCPSRGTGRCAARERRVPAPDGVDGPEQGGQCAGPGEVPVLDLVLLRVEVLLVVRRRRHVLVQLVAAVDAVGRGQGGGQDETQGKGRRRPVAQRAGQDVRGVGPEVRTHVVGQPPWASSSI